MSALESNALFKALTKRELAYVAPLLYERHYQPNEPIFQQGDRGLGMYIIVRGKVHIKTETPTGDVHITTLKDGSFFGELALIDPNNVRTASALPTEPATLVGFFKPDLLEIIERKPAVGAKILFQLSTVLGRRLLETTERVTLITRARDVAEAHDDVI